MLLSIVPISISRSGRSFSRSDELRGDGVSLEEVLEAGVAFRIMLDNFTPDQIREAVALINGRAEAEASGGINENTLVSYAETGVNYISMGALTHHVKSFDLSLKAVK